MRHKITIFFQNSPSGKEFFWLSLFFLFCVSCSEPGQLCRVFISVVDAAVAPLTAFDIFVEMQWFVMRQHILLIAESDCDGILADFRDFVVPEAFDAQGLIFLHLRVELLILPLAFTIGRIRAMTNLHVQLDNRTVWFLGSLDFCLLVLRLPFTVVDEFASGGTEKSENFR